MTTEQEPEDNYWRLGPTPRTPPEETCSCEKVSVVLLQTHLSQNPLVCLKCWGELSPAKLRLSAALVEKVAFWRNVAMSLEHLWLDSGEYERWANDRRTDPTGSVTKRALEIVQAIRKTHRALYSWPSAAEDDVTKACPACGAEPILVSGTYEVSQLFRDELRMCEPCLLLLS